MTDSAMVAALGARRPGQGESLRRFIIVTATAMVLMASLWLDDSEQLALFGAGAGLLVLMLYGFDYLHPTTAYLVPWLVVLLFSTLPISGYARALDDGTIRFLLFAIFTWQLATLQAPVVLRSQPAPIVVRQVPRKLRFGILFGFLFLYLFAAFNIAYAGYLPLLSLITQGISDYADFGIPSVFGAFLAYSNALACLALYAWLRHGRRLYLLLFLSVLGLHLAFVSRQNMVTLLIEAFVMRCLLGRRISRVTLLIWIVAGLTGFAALGSLRSGDIGDIIRLQPDYEWLPTPLLWLYAYSYFNVLNLENMITQSGAPYLDGSMWQNLLPSVLRPEVNHGVFVEIEALNVSSYIYPIYLDVGAIGVVIATACWGFITAWVYRQALLRRRFLETASYACLYGCALLSFFVDFWFYLPVIFQTVFFLFFHVLLFKRSARPSPGLHAALPLAKGHEA